MDDKVEVEWEWLQKVLAALAALADEVEAEADARYPSRAEYPIQRRRYERDMAIVNSARSLIVHRTRACAEPG